jgi:shikimate kinase
MKGDLMPPERRGRGLALVGFRGTGKTTVGRLLASAMNRRFVDVDREIECRSGRSIAAIFAETGEAAFRDWEECTLAEVFELYPEAVVATGGGSVMREHNRSQMRAFGQIVWLTADPDELARRLQTDERGQDVRPPLTSKGVIEEISHVLRERLPIYQRLADLVIETGGKSPEEVASAILPGVASWRSA